MADLLVFLFYLFTAHLLSQIPVAVFLMIPTKPSLLQFKWTFFRYALAGTVLLCFGFVFAFSLAQQSPGNVADLFQENKNHSVASDQPTNPYDLQEQQTKEIRPIIGTGELPDSAFIINGFVKGFLLLWLTSLAMGVLRFLYKVLKQEMILKAIGKQAHLTTYQNIQVYVSNRIKGAFCRSWPRREIYVPAREWADEKLRHTILIHESLHLAKHHPRTLLLARFLAHLFQLNPLLHFAARQGEELSEYICDFHGTQVIPPKDYLRQLLRSAEQKLSQGSFLPLSSPWLKQGELKKRIKMILTKEQEDRMKTQKHNWLFIAMVLTLLGVGLACGPYISLMAQDIGSAENEAVQGSIEFPDHKDELEAENVQKQRMSLIYPIEEGGRMTLVFGETTHPIKGGPYFHKGVDIAWTIGSPIKAALSGKVSEKGYEPKARGHYMIITHDSGYEVLYSHLDSIEVSQGQRVEKGQIVAKLGNSGLSTGPHLHFEVHDPAGEPVDPLKFFPELQEKSVNLK